LLGIDAVSGKTLQKPAVWCQHPNGGVASADYLRRYLDDALKHPFQGHFGDQRRGGYDQPFQPWAARSRTGD
jgi:hypothetical protein